MKQNNHNQEILLNSHCSFFKREYAEKLDGKQQKKLSQKEKIAELCWNGLLPSILPEISEAALYIARN